MGLSQNSEQWCCGCSAVSRVSIKSVLKPSFCELTPKMVLFIHSLNVIAVAESSTHIAKNRACGLAVAIFHRCPELLIKFQELSGILNKKDVSTKDDGGDEG